jgi:hypothetical protein
MAELEYDCLIALASLRSTGCNLVLGRKFGSVSASGSAKSVSSSETVAR